MTELNIFATQLASTGQTGSKAAASSGKHAALGGNGIGNAANFWEIILGNIEQNTASLNADGDGVDLESTQAVLQKDEADLALLQLALLGQNKNLENQLSDLQLERIHNRLDNRTTQLSKLIDHLTSGLPVTVGKGGSVEELISRLEKQLENLETSLEAFLSGDFGDEGAPFELLIATGLSPNDLTKITNRIEEVETKLGRKLTVEDLIAGVGNIIPVPGDDRDNHTLSVDLAAIQLANNAANNTSGQATTRSLGDIPQQLTNAEFNALFAGTKNAKNGITKANFMNLLQAQTNLTPVQHSGDIHLPLNWLQQTTSLSLQSDALGFDVQTGMPFSPAAQATHAATSIPQAGQTHPATQMVTAHISKAAQNGEIGKMVLQLDPPELGRVEIKLEFGQDNTVKAALIVEKSETLLMLQRDTAALERALQNAGLETDSGSLNYEMAQKDYAFNSDNNGNNHQNGAGNSSGNNAEDDETGTIIETTMTWNVDPKTGHVHYNLLA